MFKREFLGQTAANNFGLCSVLLAWHLSASCLSVVNDEHVPLVSQNLSCQWKLSF